jgi:hypothetical protein
MWVIDHKGLTNISTSALYQLENVKGYVQEAKTNKEDIAQQLLDASEFVPKIFEMMPTIEASFDKLESMVMPHVIYILFAASGNMAVVARYRIGTVDFLKRYPDTLTHLPASYKSVGEELLNVGS